MNQLKILRIFALLEGISTVVLFGISMPLKYMFDQPASVRPVGMAHGILFLAYCFWVLLVAYQMKWKKAEIFWSLVASLFPLGTFIADYQIFKKKADAQKI